MANERYCFDPDFPEKTTPVDTDRALLYDSANGGTSRWFSFLNLYNYLKAKFDLVYSVINLNHNDTANKQGGTTNEYYHATLAEKNSWSRNGIDATVGTTGADYTTLSAVPSDKYNILVITDITEIANKTFTTNKNYKITGLNKGITITTSFQLIGTVSALVQFENITIDFKNMSGVNNDLCSIVPVIFNNTIIKCTDTISRSILTYTNGNVIITNSDLYYSQPFAEPLVQQTTFAYIKKATNCDIYVTQANKYVYVPELINVNVYVTGLGTINRMACQGYNVKSTATIPTFLGSGSFINMPNTTLYDGIWNYDFCTFKKGTGFRDSNLNFCTFTDTVDWTIIKYESTYNNNTFIGCTFNSKVSFTGDNYIFNSCKIGSTTGGLKTIEVLNTSKNAVIINCRVEKRILNTVTGFYEADITDNGTGTRLFNNITF